MTREEAIIILGNIPINGDECYSIPQYQEAKTMAIDALKFDIDQYCKEHFVVMVDEDVWDKAEKALDQEPILDKIRAEIEAMPKTYPFVNHIETYVKDDDVMKIIDKYRGDA